MPKLALRPPREKLEDFTYDSYIISEIKQSLLLVLPDGLSTSSGIEPAQM